MSGPATGQPPVDAGGGGIGLGRELGHPPRDGVSNLRFSKHSDRLLVSSWEKVSSQASRASYFDPLGWNETQTLAAWFDPLGSVPVRAWLCVRVRVRSFQTVRLLDVDATDALVGSFVYKTPVLDCCFYNDDDSGFTVSTDHVVRRLSFRSRRTQRLGTHDGPVGCVEYSDTGQLITGSWDKTIKCWDPRGLTGRQHTLVGTYDQPERVYALSLAGHKLVVATAGGHVNVYDLRDMSKPEQRQSFLDSQTRCVGCYPNKTGFALGTMDGRVAMDFFDQSESSLAKRYIFKCHRLTEDRRTFAYPVNAIAFHRGHGTFATGGCDGFVYTWDGIIRRDYFSSPGTQLALLLCLSARITICSLLHPVTLTKGEK
uniref:Mitotic checkpoint protein BUB3 n=1 Tax=Hordeum vulgare subsp. vulgare TaxID=112509 RepID=A0A8I6WI31_HORVV